MQTNNHQIVDYDKVLDAEFGKPGTPERIAAEEEAYAFYTGQIIEDAFASNTQCHWVNQPTV